MKSRKHKTTLEQRFWKKVDKTPTCWNWTSSQNGDGYGQLQYSYNHATRKTVRILAHRYSWMLHNSNSQPQNVLHHCDNPKCVRPDHLYSGTKSDNARDTLRRNRGFGSSKLSPDNVREIRALLVSEQHTNRAIAKRFGVSDNMITFIKHGHYWNWLI